ncbi:MAG: uracil permease, partial [Spirochaetaceae bacterium]|nr:uracil permease [Spirochaetaceae bacterium]
MELVYKINDKPSPEKILLFALQQLLAVMAATIAVPAIVGNGLSASAALFGAGVGTIVYLLFTKSKSPVFLGSSFAFIGSMFSAFAGAASVSVGYWGLILGAVMAGLVYVIIAVVVRVAGTAWIDRLLPPVIIGPTVAIIGLSLSGNAVGDLAKSSVDGGSTHIAMLCGLVTLFVTMMCSTYGKKLGKLIPFIQGILAGYILASVFAVIG